MVHEQLRNHRNAAVETAAVALFKSAVNEIESYEIENCSYVTPPIIQTGLYWALELNNDDLYQHVGTCGLKWLDTQDTVLSMVAQHIQGRSTDHSETIEWETW